MNVNTEIVKHGVTVPPNILVMEDEQNVASGLKMVLTEEGYSVDLAVTGKDALDIFDSKPFDILIADLRLPDINGMDVIRAVKSKNPETGVVVITGYASVDSAVDAMKLGSFDYLPKPFTDDEIKTAVEGAIKGRKSVSADAVVKKLEHSEDEKLIQKQEVKKVLERAAEDRDFWRILMERGSGALSDYHLSNEARAAIISGDLKWIRQHVGMLSREQLAFIYSRLEREAW